MVILIDDEDRENEGDLRLAAEKVTPAAISFMARHGRGLICLSLTEEKVAGPAAAAHGGRDLQHLLLGTAFTVSIEAREGVTTGISAKDRAHTILTAVREDCRPEDLARPGHVFPLRARARRGAGARRPDRGLGGPGPAGRARRRRASSAR